MQETRPFISWKLAEEFMTAVFEKYGVPKEDAAVCADGQRLYRFNLLRRNRYYV